VFGRNFKPVTESAGTFYLKNITDLKVYAIFMQRQ